MNRMPMKALRLIFIIVLLTLAAGCAKVSRPEQNLRERLDYNEETRAGYNLDQNWWLVYENQELNRLMDKALAANIDLAQAAVSVNRALYQAKLISADLVPSFSGGLDGSARKNIKEGGPSTRSASGSVSLSYELDLWRKVAAAASAGQWEYQATIEDKEAARLALIGSVVDAYYHLAYLNDALAAGRDNLANYRSIEKTVQAKSEAGKVAAIEVAQARQAVLSAESSLIDLESQHKSAEQTLKNLLNLKPGESFGFAAAPGLSGQKLPDVNLDIPLAVLANRPDLRAAEFRLEKAFKNVEEAEKGWLPSITLGAAINSSSDAIRTALNNPVASGTLSINLPFLDWSRVLYNLRISEMDFEKQRLEFEKTLTTALNEVDTLYYEYEKSRQSLDKTRAKYVEDRRVAAYYQDRYQAGAAELSDWLSAVNTANSSRLSSLNTLYQALSSQSMLYKAMAGRWNEKAR
ncbi:TolC family protein [Deltaproteobacteria bacterium OttesenSCG-928-K17]|nr:TolC family protein [Deltaproteobacteria bacterium OttesenSCG-928-K17]